MGQPMRVVSERQLKAGVVRFEFDRSITGSGHESYGSAPVDAVRPVDVLAAKLFETSDVLSVHIFSNMADVTFGASDIDHELQQMRQAIESLFTYYLPGVVPTQIG